MPCVSHVVYNTTLFPLGHLWKDVNNLPFYSLSHLTAQLWFFFFLFFSLFSVVWKYKILCTPVAQLLANFTVCLNIFIDYKHCTAVFVIRMSERFVYKKIYQKLNTFSICWKITITTKPWHKHFIINNHMNVSTYKKFKFSSSQAQRSIQWLYPNKKHMDCTGDHFAHFFLYNLYIFVWIQHWRGACLNSSNGFIKTWYTSERRRARPARANFI